MESGSHSSGREKPSRAPLGNTPHHCGLRQQRRDHPSSHVEHTAVSEGIRRRASAGSGVVAGEVDAVLLRQTTCTFRCRDRLGVCADEQRLACQRADSPPLAAGAAAGQVDLEHLKRESPPMMKRVALRQREQDANPPDNEQQSAGRFNQVLPRGAEVPRIII